MTGRSHQIRVQLSAKGHSLFGDQKYGAEVNKPGQQIALWANQIRLLHPTLRKGDGFYIQSPNEFPWDLFKHVPIL